MLICTAFFFISFIFLDFYNVIIHIYISVPLNEIYNCCSMKFFVLAQINFFQLVPFPKPTRTTVFLYLLSFFLDYYNKIICIFVPLNEIYNFCSLNFFVSAQINFSQLVPFPKPTRTTQFFCTSFIFFIIII